MKKLHIAVGLASVFAAAMTHAGTALDPLEMRWTFGAHEPYTMYRRVGRHCTGGIDGNAKWVKPWLDWFDAESPAVMQSLGLNWVHSRFYKGMGWEEEKKDFLNVKRFVANCHAHGIKALAYVQFSTLYPATMKHEIPDLDDWAQVDEHGEKRGYHASYFRWLPCITNEKWVEYIARMCTIALTEGSFDGIMFDNASVRSCFCPRCERLFHEHLMKIPHPEERFGFASLAYIPQPRETAKSDPEVRDPVIQAWLAWREQTLRNVFTRLRDHIKSVRPDAIVCANPMPFRNQGALTEFSLNMARFARLMDLILMQSDNFPEVLKDGMIINRVRDLKIAREIDRPILALCDADAKMTEARERHYLLPLVEDLVWGGIPTDRTIISPKPLPGFVDQGIIARRRPKLDAFNAFARAHRDALAAPSYLPVRLFWSPEATYLSEHVHQGLAAAEEICLRNQIPFGYIVSTPEKPLDVPEGCEVIVVANQTCLADAQVDALAAYAAKGGRLVVTGDSGRYDELNAQRLANPLLPRLKGLKNVVLRATPDILPSARLGWVYRVVPPKDGGRQLVADIAATGWKPAVYVENAPPCVFIESKKTDNGYALHLVNYDPDHPVSGIRVFAPAGSAVRYKCPFEALGTEGTGGSIGNFAFYALVEISRQNQEKQYE